MTRLYIIRHAEAEGNLGRRVHGWYDSLITKNGQAQIEALSQRFADIHIDGVYSSNLTRTMTTAGAVYKPKNLPLWTEPGLREVNLGIWEDYPFGEIARTHPAQLKEFVTMSPAFSIEGGESFPEVQRRAMEAIEKIVAAHPNQTLALFSHGMAIRCMQAAFLGLGVDEIGTMGHSDNTAVTCVDVTDGKYEIVFANDNSHLTEEISTLAKQHWWRKEGKLLDANLWFRPMDVAGEDEALYLQARQEAWVDIHGSDLPFDGAGFLADACANVALDPHAIMCAMLGDEVAGIIQMNPQRGVDEGVGFLPFVYMSPKYRKQGLGIQLLGQAISFYRPMGRTKLRLRCAPDNGVAQRFYKRHGFYKIGNEQGATVPLDILENYIGYEKL